MRAFLSFAAMLLLALAAPPALADTGPPPDAPALTLDAQEPGLAPAVSEAALVADHEPGARQPGAQAVLSGNPAPARVGSAAATSYAPHRAVPPDIPGGSTTPATLAHPLRC